MRFSWAGFATQLPGFILRTLLKGANAVNLGSGPRLGRQLAASGGRGGGSALCSAGSKGGLALCSVSFISTWKKSAFLVYLCLLEGVVSGCQHFLHLSVERWKGRLEETNQKSSLKGQFRTSPFLAAPSAARRTRSIAPSVPARGHPLGLSPRTHPLPRGRLPQGRAGCLEKPK